MKETPKPSADRSKQPPPHIYQNWRESFVRPMLTGALIFGFVALILALLTNQGPNQNAVFIGSYLLLIVVTFVPMPYGIKMGAFLFIIYALGMIELLSTGILGDSIFFFLSFIVFATLMFSPRRGGFAIAATMVTFALMGWLAATGSIHYLSANAMPAKVSDWLSASATTLLFSTVIVLGLRQLENEFMVAQKKTDEAVQAVEVERAGLEERIAERTVQLKAVNEVGRAASAILDPEELIARVVNLITDQFNFYYAALFLVDTQNEWAELHNATGEAGRVLKENKHRLRIGGKSMVGTAISSAQPRIAQDVDIESERFQNPLLPYTRSEIALPLIVGDRVLGALDVQSTKENAFGPQEIDVLQGMAGQVAIAFENARLYQNARKNLDEMRAIQRQYVLASWKPIAEEKSLQYHVGDEDLPEDANQLAIPMALRDEIIGEIDLSGDKEWTPEERNMVEAVATQAALALENARLIEESQSTAVHEHLLAEITGRIWSSQTVEGVLQSAVRELGHALDAAEATIELKMDDDDE